jgi:uncharacterized protein (TIGR03437 family)
MSRSALFALAVAGFQTLAHGALIPQSDRKPAPDFSLADSGGRIVRRSAYLGDVVVVNYWTTWCAPSTEEIPVLMEFQKTYQARGFHVIGISMDDFGWDDVRPYLKLHPVSYDIVVDDSKTSDAFGGIDFIPITFLIDRNGRVAERLDGKFNNDAIRASVETLLAESGGKPRIASVSNAASYQPAIAPGSWVTITGSSLSKTTRSWQGSDFAGGALPTELDGVSVKVNGKRAYVAFVSPGQINILSPDDSAIATRDVRVEVTTAVGVSDVFQVRQSAFAPALFTLQGGSYVIAQAANGDLIGPANLIPGLTLRPARPGETVTLYGTGFGPSSPAAQSGLVVTQPLPMANQPAFRIGSQTATVTYAGLTGSGLVQINLQVPDVPSGDQPIVATAGGVPTPAALRLTIGR